MMLKLYVYGYLNQLCSSRRVEREAGRNVELMWQGLKTDQRPEVGAPPVKAIQLVSTQPRGR